MASSNAVTEKLNKMTISGRDRMNDGLFQTRRTKLHENRREINDKINKELRMKDGARNLIELTKDKKLKSKINIEIDYFESNLKLWKEELEKANSALDTYQNMKCGLPMIPIALKNTIDLDLCGSFRNVLSSHYLMTQSQVEEMSEAIDLINVQRKKIQKPQRNEKGLDDHISYYNLLCHAEKRFFFPDRSNGIIFSWNDIFTGVPFQQRTVIFEKSGVIFNLAALYSQLAASKDKSTNSGLEDSQTFLLSAEACFVYLRNHFINPPSVDLRPELLNMLASLMRTQALECKFLLLKKIKMNEDKYSNLRCLELVSEAFAMSQLFDSVYGTLNMELLQYLDHVPQSWINLVQVKSNYYKALAYQILAYRYRDLAVGKYTNEDGFDDITAQTPVEYIIEDLSKEVLLICRPTKCMLQLPTNHLESLGMAKLLVNEALQLIEEAIKLAAMNQHLRNLEDLSSFLQQQHKQWIDNLHQLNKQKSYDLLSCPELQILARQDVSTEITLPLITSSRPEPDIFRKLGPVEIFNTRTKFTEARTLTLLRDISVGTGFGFTVKGAAPVRVVAVEKYGNAEKGGMRAGDIILQVDNVDLRWANQEAMVNLIGAREMFTVCVIAVQLNTNAVLSNGGSSEMSGRGLGRHNTVSGVPSFLESSETYSQTDGTVGLATTMSALKKGHIISAPKSASVKLTWKQRLSGTWKRRKSNKNAANNQVTSTLF